jgi:hypothetical protein
LRIVLGRGSSEKENGELAEALESVRVSLDDGLQESEAQGTPISGKFEMEDGKLQLSVYTMKDGKFLEVIVDHKTGKIAKAEPITGGDDLTAAKAQAEAMAKAAPHRREQGRCGQQWVPGGQHYSQPERGTSFRPGHPGQERSFQQDLVALGLVRNCVRALSWVRKQDSP